MITKQGRYLSSYQEAPWMRKIAKLRKYKNQAKGEKHWGAKLIAGQVFCIRHPDTMPRELANKFARIYGISAGHVYHIRARRKWKHL